MTCHELDERLDDWLDGALAGAEREALEAHLASCAACREQAERLRQLLAHAAALPRSLTPPRDLWPEVALRIERASAWAGPLGSWRPLALAAAAAALVGLGALLWSGSRPAAVRSVAMPSATAQARPVAQAGIEDPVLAAAAADYEAAASALLEVLERRRAVLPPDDLALVEANLEVIDRALAELREALAQDPASPELNRMLVSTHRKKVDVLRRVVHLSTTL